MTLCLYFLLPRPLISTLFPYTTLFRSAPFRTCRFLGIAVAAGGAMANGFESDFIAQGKKMKSLRARMHHNGDRKSTRLNSSHVAISYAVFCLKKKKKKMNTQEEKTQRV